MTPDPRSDEGVLATIKKLVQDEHELHSQGTLDPKAKAKLDTLRVELDQCWDLLRQRRALREFGEDPDKATVRSASVVERYEQ